jgi:hypothetical protein
MAKRKTTAKTREAYEATSSEPVPITPLEYGGLQAAFTFLNGKLFDGALPDVFLTLSRRAKSGGHFAPDRLTKRGGNGEREHEVNLNPDIFTTKTDEFVVSILLHEMCHLAQHCEGTAPKKAGYHNARWAEIMIQRGLMPTANGMVGGRTTGSAMSHYIIDGGAFREAFRELAATGWRLHLESTPYRGESRAPSSAQSKTKFTCPACAANVWGKPETEVACIRCGNVPMRSGAVPANALSTMTAAAA